MSTHGREQSQRGSREDNLSLVKTRYDEIRVKLRDLLNSLTDFDGYIKNTFLDYQDGPGGHKRILVVVSDLPPVTNDARSLFASLRDRQTHSGSENNQRTDKKKDTLQNLLEEGDQPSVLRGLGREDVECRKQIHDLLYPKTVGHPRFEPKVVYESAVREGGSPAQTSPTTFVPTPSTESSSRAASFSKPGHVPTSDGKGSEKKKRFWEK